MLRSIGRTLRFDRYNVAGIAQSPSSALQQLVAMGKSDGIVRAGPAELWASVWFALVEFVVGRIAAKEWTADHPQVSMALEAAWDAVSAKPEG